MCKRFLWLMLGLTTLLMLNMCGLQGNGQPLPFNTIVQDNNLNDDEKEAPTLYIIATSRETAEFSRDVVKLDPQIPDQRQRLVDKLTQLDYNDSFAILILQGQKPPRGFRISVQQITRQSDRVIVHATFDGPGPGEGQPMVSPDPFTLVTVTQEGTWGKRVQFELVTDGKVVAQATHFIR